MNLLRDAKLARQEALKSRFDPIIRDLSRATNYQSFYLQAVYGVFFSAEEKPDKFYKEWLKKNKELVNDARLPLATQIAAYNLKGQLYSILGEEEKSIACFEIILKLISNSSGNIAGFHLLQESLEETLLVKYYKIEPGYFKDKICFTGAINNAEELFCTRVAPFYERNRTAQLSEKWDVFIIAYQKICAGNLEASRKFDLIDHPRLLLLKAESLERVGNSTARDKVLREIIQNYPAYPNFSEVLEKLGN